MHAMNVSFPWEGHPDTMQADQKDNVPQEGTDTHVGVGESLPVVRSPRKRGDSATGCRTYSGGGEETLGAMHPRRPLATATRTPTDQLNTRPETDRLTDRPISSSLDLSSLASAISPPPSILSAWTQVEPRQKGGKKKKKKKTKTDRTTNIPTGRSGGQPTLEPGRTADACVQSRARDLAGQGNVGRPPPQGVRPTAPETVVSGQATDVAKADQPGTSRDSLADTQKNQQLTNTQAQCRPNPVARRTNKFWRERSRGEAGREPGDPGPSTSQSHQKRDRLDDTISPRGEHKRRKTDRPTHMANSYARAAKPHLNVAVALAPRATMTQQEADNIQKQIQSAIFDACTATPTTSTAAYAPAFDGRAFLYDGVLKLWCIDEQALQWLQRLVPRLKSPREGTELIMIRQSDIPVKVKSALFVPNYEEEVGKLHRILTVQNPWYEIATWTLYTYHKVNGRTPGIFLVLGIPEEQINNILARGRKVAYSTGSIYIRFFTSEGVSDVPPRKAPLPDTSNMETDNETTTTEETGKQPQSSQETPRTTEPSLSTVLTEVEAVLEEEPSNPQQSGAQWRDSTEKPDTDATALTLQELLDSWAPKAGE